ncbi:polysaccharide pyruvyl transferase family protein [Microbacterium saperdae]
MTRDSIAGVGVTHWNPRRNRWPFPINRLPIGPRVNNFGDLLGPAIAERIVREEGLAPVSPSDRSLLTVGSIMGLANDGDVVWGTGVNGKVAVESHVFSSLDVRAVRGPRTAEFLRARRIEVPDVFGDPALLIPQLFPEWAPSSTRRALGVLPNFHDFDRYRDHPDVISPIGTPEQVIREIVASERIVASSLHGVIIAEAFGIPAVAIESGVEHPFKYLDYFEGTGRPDVPLVSDLSEGIRLVETVSWSALSESWDPAPLRAAFPTDLWTGYQTSRALPPVEDRGHE